MNLAQKLVEVMKAVESVPKNGWNEFHKYPYALEADIVQAVRGKLADLGVLILSSIEDARRTGDVTEVFSKHTFLDAETGESREVKWYGQGQDKGDKGAYKAETGIVKYLLLKTFLIPTGDDPEKDDLPPTNGAKPKANGKGSTNGKAPPSSPKASTSENDNKATDAQMKEIETLAKELEKDVKRDILDRMGLSLPIDKFNATKILNRLKELKATKR